MADVVYVSSHVILNSFDHVSGAINAWGDVGGSTFEYHPAKLIVTQREGDLFIIAAVERDVPRLLFRSFDLRNVSDLLAIFTPIH